MKRVMLLLITFILIPWDIWSQTPGDLCQPPTNITVVDISTDSATITWTRGGTETAWELAVGNSVFYQGIDCGNLAQGRAFYAGVKINL